MRTLRIHAAVLLAIPAVACWGQVETIYVRPVQTHSGYDPSEDSSAVSWNSGVQAERLVLFLGGTWSSSSADYNALRLFSAGLGFDFINLSYPNDVAAASLADDPDTLAFDKYRQELCFGEPVSADVDVDSLNSIHTRAVNLLRYLDQTFPAQDWEQYLATDSTLDWSRIIIGGHSQGSGHACYLAKHFAVDRVLLFAGPNDYSDLYTNSAHWVRQAGETPASRHYSYLSLNDETVAYAKQVEVVSGLGMLQNDDSTHVDGLSSPYGSSHCLYTTQPPGLVLLNHNAPVMLSAINIEVWTYMLTYASSTSAGKHDSGQAFSAFPNPTSSIFYVSIPGAPQGTVFTLYDATGCIMHHGRASTSERFIIDVSGFSPGVYFVTMDERTIRVVKQ